MDKLTQAHRVIIEVMIQNNIDKLNYKKDLYKLDCNSKREGLYTLFINSWYFSSFMIKRNKVVEPPNNYKKINQQMDLINRGLRMRY